MKTIPKFDGRNALFLETGHHLLNDPAPSVFLNAIRKKQEFKVYPFNMLHRLQETRQPPQHHPEGSVWNHTLLVVDEAAQVRAKSRDSKVFMWAALLHDIGKPAATRVRNGRITAYDHDKVGAELAREFLLEFVEDSGFADRVSALVRYHMHVLYVEKGLPFADVTGMSEQTDVGEVALLGLCDRLGRLGSDRESEENNIKLFLQKVGYQDSSFHPKSL